MDEYTLVDSTRPLQPRTPPLPPPAQSHLHEGQKEEAIRGEEVVLVVITMTWKDTWMLEWWHSRCRA